MEPKTKLQKQVVVLHSKLPVITDYQKKWAEKVCFTLEGFYRAKRYGAPSAETSLKPKNRTYHIPY